MVSLVDLEFNLAALFFFTLPEITSLKRVVKPEDELELGQTINAKIINIDKEKCKIGLSIKELEGTSSEYGYQDYIKGEDKENE